MSSTAAAAKAKDALLAKRYEDFNGDIVGLMKLMAHQSKKDASLGPVQRENAEKVANELVKVQGIIKDNPAIARLAHAAWGDLNKKEVRAILESDEPNGKIYEMNVCGLANRIPIRYMHEHGKREFRMSMWTYFLNMRDALDDINHLRSIDEQIARENGAAPPPNAAAQAAAAAAAAEDDRKLREELNSLSLSSSSSPSSAPASTAAAAVATTEGKESGPRARERRRAARADAKRQSTTTPAAAAGAAVAGAPSIEQMKGTMNHITQMLSGLGGGEGKQAVADLNKFQEKAEAMAKNAMAQQAAAVAAGTPASASGMASAADTSDLIGTFLTGVLPSVAGAVGGAHGLSDSSSAAYTADGRKKSDRERKAEEALRKAKNEENMRKFKHHFGTVMNSKELTSHTSEETLRAIEEDERRSQNAAKDTRERKKCGLTAHFNRHFKRWLNDIVIARRDATIDDTDELAFPLLVPTLNAALSIKDQSSTTLANPVSVWVHRHLNRIRARDASIIIESKHPWFVALDASAYFQSLGPDELEVFWSLSEKFVQMAMIYYNFDSMDEFSGMRDIVDTILTDQKIRSTGSEQHEGDRMQAITDSVMANMTGSKMQDFKKMAENFQKDPSGINKFQGFMQQIMGGAGGGGLFAGGDGKTPAKDDVDDGETSDDEFACPALPSAVLQLPPPPQARVPTTTNGGGGAPPSLATTTPRPPS